MFTHFTSGSLSSGRQAQLAQVTAFSKADLVIMEASKTINRLRWKFSEVFEKDVDGFMDEVNSLQLITSEEYRNLCEVVSPVEKTLSLIDLILHKGEETCQKFLSNREHMIPRFPGLSSVSEHLQDSKLETFTELLVQLGMEKSSNSKLTLRNILSIDLENLHHEKPKTTADLPEHFLMNLIALHRNARQTELDDDLSNLGSSADDDDPFDLFTSKTMQNPKSKSINPLDVLCAVLNCSDKCLQQELVSKMSMCQFPVPLVLPSGDGSRSTFMRWAMRDIVKKWRPQSLADSKGFREDNVVNIEMPIFSFVRLGPNKLSKSKILNQVLNTAQQHHEFFIHDNMDGGNIEKKISDGLVEMSWYFPCGKSDVFPEPIAVANLRGDLEFNCEQFTFLTRISSATFLFIESMCERQFRLLSSFSPSDIEFYFIVTPGKDKGVDPETRKHMQNLIPLLKLEKTNVVLKSSTMNDAEFMNMVQKIINGQLKKNPKLVKVRDITTEVSDLHISIDEASPEFLLTSDYALNITSMIDNVERFKKESLTLQGDLWKKLSKLEKEFCRMKKQGGEDQEIYRSKLKVKRNLLHREQNKHALPEAMTLFINALTHLSRDEKPYFLKWMKFELDFIARKNVSKLQAKYKEICSQSYAADNAQELKQLDKSISESSLGIEHFLRELGQFYEAEYSTVKKKSSRKFSHFPGIAADLLLDGFPLELIDGDASNIPLQWITDVLTELNKKTGGQCRMRVITVLGVQSTGKSTLLNTMFGLQFPVASGRCTRGAFMTLNQMKENFQKMMGCEFILVIDTEGLKAPELFSLEDSYEHDNELATLVVGLSDVTIINMAMENTTEMKDILQIVVHAFLRMKQVGKKPNCQFVHQNVSDVSAHDQNIRDRKKLLEQLNEMTKVAAKMEKKSGFDKFSDVMDYDLDKHNWYIPGLWQGVPPMAPVNSGYSEHVSELKKYLLQFLQSKTLNRALTIPDFCKWVKNLWNAVKNEKFIFSFRNSLVAEAYNKLSMQFSQWEWNFTKKVYNWVMRKETNIKNQPSHNFDENTHETIKDLDQLLHKEEKKMLDLLEKYFESDFENLNLIERYWEDFKRSITGLRKELRRNVIDKYQKTLSIQKGNLKIRDIKKKYQTLIEEKIDGLLKTCREKDHELSDDEVKDEFNAMWEKTLSDLQIEKLERCRVSDAILRQLRNDMSNKGPDINKALLAEKMLADQRTNFTIYESHIDLLWFSKIWEQMVGKKKESYDRLDNFASSLIEMCDRNVSKMENTNEDYDDTYCQEILQMINRKIENQQNKNLHFTLQFELDIKLFIFRKASTRFQQMHDRYIERNDPKTCMDNLKPDYLTVFLDVFKAKDASQSRVKQFCVKCLSPAIIDYVYNHLGKKMVDDVLEDSSSQMFKSRSFFQYNLLKDLLDEMSFKKYAQYTQFYETFCKEWIQSKMEEMYEKRAALQPLQADLISSILKDVKDVLRDETILESEDIPQFLENVQKKLDEKLVISQETMTIVAFNNQVNVRQFSTSSLDFLASTEQQILSQLKSMTFPDLLSKLKLKPQDELFSKVIGCGHRCPFCRVPCEAEGADHNEHFASVHRPQGLGHYKWEGGKKLVTDICTSSVVSLNSFSNLDTGCICHPYKEYRTYYPDWTIQPDPSIKSSDYWKFIFAKFNTEFAKDFYAEPAELPDDWKEMTEEDALNSLKETFNIS
ncbi:interferon-induced very large GTPase 1-like [Phyllobates terribilis]|uniref:interferon-induced very large GTPase 1-like n=1 Tax=Phyllobates terribilis TaxID=111132 RepID=UPI003CCB2160